MGLIREPLDVDFVVEPMTEKDRESIRIAVMESKLRAKSEEEKLLKKINSKSTMKRKAKVLA